MKKLALFLLFLMGGLIVYSQFSKPISYNFFFRLKSAGLKDAVEEILKDSEGRYGIYIKNLKAKEIYAKNEHDEFEPGSLYKIWVLGAVFEKVKEGRMNEEDEITADIVALNREFDIDPADAELTEGLINFSVKSAIEQMITISHNYAAMALTKKVGHPNITAFLKNYGLLESSLDVPLKTSAFDMGALFEKLYKGEIINQEYSQKMLAVLSQQKINDRIPKYLPGDTKVAHKTGDTGYFKNDAGIVFTLNDDFIIVVLSETKNPDGAGEKIARISEAVYEYFNK